MELAQERLAVELVPAPEPKHRGHMVRQAVSSNPDWYSKLAAKMPLKRRRNPRLRCGSDIRRAQVVRALERMQETGRACWAYDYHLLPIVRRRAAYNESITCA
jgi:hypothetical protein